jgi:predicted secreted protein
MKATGQYAKVEGTVGGTAVTIAELREWTVSGSTEKVDSTVAGAKWTSHEIGMGSWEAEATVLDVDQYWVDLLFDKVTIKFFDLKDDTEAAYEGDASLDFEKSTPFDDMIENSLTFTGDGELLTPKASGTVV